MPIVCALTAQIQAKIALAVSRSLFEGIDMYAYMNHLARVGSCCLVMSLSACSDNGPEPTEMQSDDSWYSNGYVLETMSLYNGAGLLNDTQHCDWQATGRQLRCISSDTADGIAFQFDTRGRLLTLSVITAQAPDQLWLDNEYRDGKLIRSSSLYSQVSAYSSTDTEIPAGTLPADSAFPAEENKAIVTRLSWQGEDIEHYEQYDGAYPTATDAEFVELKVEWTEGRLRSMEPHSISTEMPEINARYSYDYNAKSQLQTKSTYEWAITAQSWQLAEQDSYQYDGHGNISVWSSFNHLGQLEQRQIFSWQQTDSVVENFSLTGGRVP